MNLKQCLENLKYDTGNGGVEEDSFAMICYITMANKARRLLRDSALDQRAMDDAKEYLALCCRSDSDSLRCVAES